MSTIQGAKIADQLNSSTQQICPRLLEQNRQVLINRSITLSARTEGQTTISNLRLFVYDTPIQSKSHRKRHQSHSTHISGLFYIPYLSQEELRNSYMRAMEIPMPASIRAHLSRPPRLFLPRSRRQPSSTARSSRSARPTVIVGLLGL